MFNEQDQYECIQPIGQGTYGVVWKAQDKVSKEIVALKKIKMENQNQGVPSTTMREMSILKDLQSHPNIVDLREILYLPNQRKLHLVFQYLDYDLKCFLGQFRNNISDKQVKLIMFQLVNGINFCHSRRIIHRDLKPQNLLIDKKGNLKIADFGLARTFGIPIKTLTHQIQTLWYRAPQILLGQRQYSLGVDIWAVGCIFGQLLQKRALFNGDCQIDQIFKIFKFHGTPTTKEWNNLDKLPDFKPTFPKFKPSNPRDYLTKCDDAALDLLLKMITLNPDERISMRDSLRHPYFAEISQQDRLKYIRI